jgi:hypothetical protein
MSFAGASHTPSALRIALILALAVHLTSTVFHVYFGALSVDEGFYAIAARSVMNGDVPYRDFGYSQMPLLPYVNGPLLSVTGYGLFAQRFINGLWGFLALAIAGYLVARRTRPALGVLLAVSFSTSPTWMYFVHLGKTYGFTALVAMLATWAFWDLKAGWKKFWLLGFLAVLGTGCRLPAAPFFAFLWLAALWQDQAPTWRDLFQAGTGLAFFIVVLLLPFFLLAPESGRFWPLEFQLTSVLEKKWRVSGEDLVTLAPICWMAVVLTLVLRAIRPRPRWSFAVMPGAAALVALAMNLLPTGAYEEYGVPFLLPLACVCAGELHALATNWSVSKKILLLTTLGAVHLAIAPLLTLHRGPVRPDLLSRWLPSTVPNYDHELPANLTRARKIVEQLLPKESPFIGPNLILAAETGRPVPRNLRMGPFTMTRDFSREKARRLHLMTYPEITAVFADPTVPLVAFFPSSPPNYSWSMPSFSNQPESERQQWAGLFQQQFLVAEESSAFLLLARRSAVPPDLRP